MRRALLPILAVLTGLVVAPAASAATTCSDQRVPVALSPGGPKSERVFARLCVPDGATAVHLLVHGGSYSHLYWDFPLEPERYSYVRAAADAGYATLNIDRLGVGQSSRPLSLLLTVDSAAFVLHQLATGLRTGAIGGEPFEKVFLVGHSIGTGISWTAAATHGGVDGVIATGGAHRRRNENTPLFFLGIRPALLDPHFRGRILDPGYLSLADESRRTIFYYAPTTDPAVVRRDNATKQPVPVPELAAPFLAAQATPRIRVPVLAVVGDRDVGICGGSGTNCSSSATFRAAEAPNYSPRACLRAYVLQRAGHNVNLHRNAPDWYAQAFAWSDSVLDGSLC